MRPFHGVAELNMDRQDIQDGNWEGEESFQDAKLLRCREGEEKPRISRMGTDLEKSSVCRVQSSERGERRADSALGRLPLLQFTAPFSL